MSQFLTDTHSHLAYMIVDRITLNIRRFNSSRTPTAI
jgi:hypothetical protein